MISTEKSSGHLITAYTQGKVTEKNEAEWFESTRWEDASWAQERFQLHMKRNLFTMRTVKQRSRMSAETLPPSLEAFEP